MGLGREAPPPCIESKSPVNGSRRFPWLSGLLMAFVGALVLIIVVAWGVMDMLGAVTR
jgi:hypothetical protein